MEEVLDPAEPPGLGPDALDQPGRIAVDAPFGRGRTGRRVEQPGGDRLVGGRVGGAEHGRCIPGGGHFRIWGHDRFSHGSGVDLDLGLRR